MWGLPKTAWERFGIWLAIGLALYFAYGYRHSTLRRGSALTAAFHDNRGSGT
jgi:APA family basic amino acid/polyamine antiporter